MASNKRINYTWELTINGKDDDHLNIQDSHLGTVLTNNIPENAKELHIDSITTNYGKSLLFVSNLSIILNGIETHLCLIRFASSKRTKPIDRNPVVLKIDKLDNIVNEFRLRPCNHLFANQSHLRTINLNIIIRYHII
jgi:hypothetical protein